MINTTVMQIVPELDAGGAERTTIDIANALVKAGMGSAVVSAGGRMRDRLDPDVSVFTLPVQTKNPFEMARNAGEIANLITKYGVGLVHARSRACAWSAMMATHSRHVPWVTTYHGIYNAGNLLKRLYNSIMARADAVIANSEWTGAHIRAEYPRLGVKNLTVIPRGIDVAAFDPAGVAPERVAAVRTAWGVKDGERVVLLPGRIARWKGQVVFVEAVAMLQTAGRWPAGLRALIVGDPQGRFDYVDELRRTIADRKLDGAVTLAGHTEDMPAAYMAADVVVSASTDPEAFGRVAAEASAMARPVIATDHGGARETVLRDVSGLLVPPGDADALALAITDLLVRPVDALAAMGAAGRAHIAAHYTVERMCAETIALYRKLLG